MTAIEPVTNLTAGDPAAAFGATLSDQKTFEDELARQGGGVSASVSAIQANDCAPIESTKQVKATEAAMSARQLTFTEQQPSPPQTHLVAYTPDGDTKGENPKLGSGGYKTDLPGGLSDAEAVLQGLSRLAGDTSITALPNPLRPDILQRSNPSGVQLRIGADLKPRIDIPAGTFTLTKPETIHFTGGKGNMCPTN